MKKGRKLRVAATKLFDAPVVSAWESREYFFAIFGFYAGRQDEFKRKVAPLKLLRFAVNLCRQGEIEGCAFVHFAFRPNPAAVPLDDALDNG